MTMWDVTSLLLFGSPGSTALHSTHEAKSSSAKQVPEQDLMKRPSKIHLDMALPSTSALTCMLK